MRRTDDLKVIADFYGIDSQKNVLVEEMAELTQAIMKATRKPIDMPNMVEEIADVEIMLYQIKYLLGINTDNAIDYKVDRQLNRMDSDKMKYME